MLSVLVRQDVIAQVSCLGKEMTLGDVDDMKKDVYV